MYKGKFEWPNGAYIAVVFNMSWEIPPKSLGTAKGHGLAGRASSSAKYTRIMRPVYETAFAETGGMQRLLDLWQRYEIRTSTYADGLNVTLFPDLAREVAAKGHEFLVQGWDHEFLNEMTAHEQADGIARANKAFETVLGKKASGFSSPGGHLTPETFSILTEQGFKYTCGMRNAEVPFIIRVNNKKLVGMTSYAVSDTNSGRGMNVREIVEMWRDYFDALYDEGKRGFPKMLAYGTHPVLAHGFRTRPLEEVIRYVKSRPNVWITTREQIADWVLQNYPERDLASFYPEAVASDKHYGLGLGLGGEEAMAEALSYRRE
jgi:peptidoglycan/xylan/chitin deacetylase (PgdA/CDA1 family)